MANISKRESDLLAVVRYFNSEKRNIAKLVAKLYEMHDLSTVKEMTGFTGDEIFELGDLAFNLVPKKRPLIGKIEGQLETSKREKLKGEPDISGWDRRAIHVSAESDMPTRIASDASKFIEHDLRPGDKWLSQKEFLAKYDCSLGTVAIVNKILVDHNWIEQVEPGNFRRGYKVKG